MNQKIFPALPVFPDAEIPGILKQFEAILRGDEMLSMGARVREFEETFASYTGVPHAVATNSCSAALEISMRMLDLQEGDEVIVPAETFIATAATVVREGGRPVFADIDADTFCLSESTVRAALTERTKAVIIVHMAGLITPEIFAIRDLCRERGIRFIEDAAHAPGATINGHKVGSIGDVGCFSFYPTKVITTAEGGMLTTSDPDIAAKANSLRHRGRDLEAPIEQYNDIGTNNRMSELHAILGLSQMRCLDGFVDQRNEFAQVYNTTLAGAVSDGLCTILPLPAEARHSYWRYIVRLPETMDRVKIRTAMAAENIVIDWAYDPPVHLQPVFQKLYGNRPGMLPVTEAIMANFVCLPIHCGLTAADIKRVGETFHRVLCEQ